MQACERTFVSLVIVSVSTASLCSGSIFAGPQKDDFCTESKVIQESCANLDWVNAEQKKPFIAERIMPIELCSAKTPCGRVYPKNLVAFDF